jgi:uncharacterized protein
MTVRRVLLSLLLAIPFAAPVSFCQQPRFKVLAFYSDKTEPDHVHFAKDAVNFLTERAASEHFSFEATTRWEDLNDEHLKSCQLVIWLNESPANADQRRAFEHYMENGGAWLGFHAAGYNDKDTNWQWFVDFLGGAVFYNNEWPPLPARLVADDPRHPIMAGIPADFESPANEWYVWKPSPRLNKDVRVLLTFDPSNYPIGFKDILTSGDLPVAWTNTKYKMLYMNMGHGDKILTSPTQNQLIDNAVNWLGTGAAPLAMPDASGTEISPNGVVLNPQTGKFYAVNTTHGAVTVLAGDGNTVAQVQVEKEPEAIAVNPSTNRIYVANTGSGSVTVIDGATDKAIANVKVGDLPYVIAVNPATNKAYVSKTFSNVMTVIDGKTNAASPLKAGIQADAITVDAVANKIYLTSYQAREITALEGGTDEASKIETADHVWAIAANHATEKIYAVNAGIAKAMIIGGKSRATRLVSTGEIPCAVAVDSRSGRVFIANYGGDSVTVIDGASDEVVATVHVGARPQAIAVDSGNHRVYVASPREGTTTVVDGTNNSVIATLRTGKASSTIAVNEKTHIAVALGLQGQLVVIDGSTLTTVRSWMQ